MSWWDVDLTAPPRQRPRWDDDAIAMALLGLALILAFAAAGWFPREAAGQQLYEHPPSGQHDPYRDLLSPENASCCGGGDCMPRAVRWTGGRLEAFIQEVGRWEVVDLDRVIGPPPAVTPVGTIVICWHRTYLPATKATVWQRCVMMGGVV